MRNVNRQCTLCVLFCFAVLWRSCSADGVMIRHGRSRVRHSEKVHIIDGRWSSPHSANSVDFGNSPTRIIFQTEEISPPLITTSDDVNNNDLQRYDEFKIIHIETLPSSTQEKSSNTHSFYQHSNRFSKKKHENNKLLKIKTASGPNRKLIKGVDSLKYESLTNDVLPNKRDKQQQPFKQSLTTSQQPPFDVGSLNNDQANVINFKASAKFSAKGQNHSLVTHHLGHTSYKAMPHKRLHKAGSGNHISVLNKTMPSNETTTVIVDNNGINETTTTPKSIKGPLKDSKLQDVKLVAGYQVIQRKEDILSGTKLSANSSIRGGVQRNVVEKTLEVPQLSPPLYPSEVGVKLKDNNDNILPKSSDSIELLAESSIIRTTQLSATQDNHSTSTGKQEALNHNHAVNLSHHELMSSDNGTDVAKYSSTSDNQRSTNTYKSTDLKQFNKQIEKEEPILSVGTEKKPKDEDMEGEPDLKDAEFDPSGLISEEDGFIFQLDPVSAGIDDAVNDEEDSSGRNNLRLLDIERETVKLNELYQGDDIDFQNWDETSRNNRLNLMKGRDVVTKFLQIVETQHLLGANCTAGTALNLGEGVVDQYAQERFRVEAEIAVNRANMLTR